MSEQNVKQVKTRIIHKHDIADNWALAVNFRPKQGELIIYDDRYTDSEGNEVIVADRVRYKIGDGATLVNELPFIDDTLQLMKYKTELLRAGNSQVKVELPVDAVIAGVEVREASGALVMVDSVVTKGSSKSVSSAVEGGDYLIYLREGSQGNIGHIIHGYDVCLDGNFQGGPEEIELPAPDSSGIIRVHLDEDVYMKYPEYGTQEEDYYYEYYQIYIEDDSAIDSIIKITYPSVSISISEPINEDLEITIIYQE